MTNTIITDTNSYQSKIIDYYDHSEIDYKLLWHLNQYKSLHYGYWDHTTHRLRDALQNMNLKLKEFGNIPPQSQVLDAGCGVGGSAIFLAENFDCKVTGITLPPRQAIIAKEFVAEAQLEKKVRIINGDYCNSGLGDAQFDIVWVLESSCHAPDKFQFLTECFRLLKPGGKMVIADYFENKLHTVESKKMMRLWADSWSINNFWSYDSAPELAARAGFENIVLENKTSPILKSSRRLYLYYFPGWFCDKVLNFFRIRNEVHRKNTASAYYQYKTLKAGWWQYCFFSAEKPL